MLQRLLDLLNEWLWLATVVLLLEVIIWWPRVSGWGSAVAALLLALGFTLTHRGLRYGWRFYRYWSREEVS